MFSSISINLFWLNLRTIDEKKKKKEKNKTKQNKKPKTRNSQHDTKKNIN